MHDMGGMHGFGPIAPQPDEPVFHERWEGRTFALVLVTGATRLRTGSIRPAIERLDPATYLTSSYYQRWARSVEDGLVRAGTLDVADIDRRAATGEPAQAHRGDTDPEGTAQLVEALVGPRHPSGDIVAGRFGVGAKVTVKRMAPAGHHRCPRYVRGVTGTVTMVPGGWPPPTSDGPPEPTYTIRFAMADLWGADAEPGWLYLDLWERYLE